MIKKPFNSLIYNAVISSLLLLCCIVPLHSQEKAPETPSEMIDESELLNMDLEELMNMTVTSVSKKEEKAFSAASAIYIITKEELEQRHIQNLPDALRGVPGVQVSRRSTHSWEVSIRGFDNRFSNKLLVLIDGRTIYTPGFSGVYWNLHNTPIQNIERIEIIRGPGAALWGSNAVNGVINITTKEAANTLGGQLSIESGNSRDNGFVQYSMSLDQEEKVFLRSYADYKKYNELDSGETSQGSGTDDDWDNINAGFRLDWEINNHEKILLSGDAYHQNHTSFDRATGIPVLNDYDANGFHLLTKYSRDISAGKNFSIQAYYDYYELNSDTTVNSNYHTWDLSSQYNWKINQSHELTLGAEMRIYYSKLDDPTNLFIFTPETETSHNFSSFIQDKIILSPDKVTLTIGTKLEENDYTGFEYQPSARLAYTPNDKNTFWAAVSRAVRIPNRFENESSLFFGSVVANNDAEAETLIAYELGYRVLCNKQLSLDFTTFFNDYEELIVLNTSGFPSKIDNGSDAYSYGFEMAATYLATTNWQLKSSYTYFNMDMDLDQNHNHFFSYEVITAQHKAAIQSSWSINKKLHWNIASFFTDNRSTGTRTNSNSGIAAYTQIDTQLTWQAKPQLKFRLAAYNLFDSSTPQAEQYAEVPRSIQVGLDYKF